jgi:predicted O-methyltransferase YrrM
MERWPQGIWDYVVEHTRFDESILHEMEERAARENFPIIGPAVGPWLYFFTRLLSATRVFELGSGFGYSTWYFARALKENGGGIVVHTVWDEALSKEARGWLERAGLLPCCDFHVSESILALTDCDRAQDVIFMDIDKEGYMDALPIIEQKLRPGGLLLVDNMFRHGKVIDDSDNDAETVAIRKLNATLAASDGWHYLINPQRDGLGIALRR